MLIRVGEFQFPADFIVLDINPGPEVLEKTPIILGRPFLATSNAVMNCKTGKVQLSVGKEKMEVDVYSVSTLGEDDEEVGSLLGMLNVEESVEVEDSVKPSRQPQRHLNPHMKEVVRAEVVKLLDAG